MKTITSAAGTLIAFALCVSLSLLSCRESATSTNEQGGFSRSDIARYLMNDTSGAALSTDNIYGYMILSSIKTSSIDFGTTKLFENTNAIFLDPTNSTNNAIDAGELKLNSTLVPVSGSGGVYGYGVLDYPVQAGQSYSWTLAGKNTFPALSMSVNAPASKVEINSPGLNQSVARSSGLTISWAGSYETENILIVTLKGSNKSYRYYTEDDGSYTIPAADLQSCGNGVAEISVSRARYDVKLVSSDKYALATVMSTRSIEIRLTD